MSGQDATPPCGPWPVNGNVQGSLDRLANAIEGMRREAREDKRDLHERISKLADKMDRRVGKLESAELQRKGAAAVRGTIKGVGLTAISGLVAALLIAAAKKMGFVQ